MVSDITNNLALFASGNGSNVQNIIRYFENNPKVNIKRIYCNNNEAYVLKRAAEAGIPTSVFDRNLFVDPAGVLNTLLNDRTTLIVLAGFLWLVPDPILTAFPKRIINIHPALLPKYGGKGLYGNRVHEEVIRAGENESGITIHFVNEKYDEGEIIFQFRCPVLPSDTPDTLAARIHELEYLHFPRIILQVLNQLPYQ